jgi:predicted GNAT family acetyltransferase
MDVQFYSNIDEFYNVCLPFLSAKATENNLIIGILNTLKSNIHHYSTERPLLVTVSVEKSLELVSIRTPPYKLLISHTDNLDSIHFLVKEFKIQEIKLPGITGFKTGALNFSKLWTEKQSLEYLLEVNLRIYKLDKVNPKIPSLNTFRPAKQTDAVLINNWIREFIQEATPNSPEEELQNLQTRTNKAIDQETIYVLERKEKLVSIARRAGKTPYGERIALVYTPPEERRKGYATELVARLSQLILDEGIQSCYLFTDLANPTSNKIYQEIGYRPIIDIDTYRFTSESV